jgi:uncharacterized protein (TIGR02217 family)
MFIEDARFPDCISFGATGGPVWQTELVRTGGGKGYSNQLYDQALRHFDVSHAARKQALFDELLAFHHAMLGRTHAFRFRDWLDYQATGGQGAFELLTATTFQMVKAYAAGSATHYRLIQKPYAGDGGIVVTGGSGADVDYTTGIVTVASGTPTQWVGPFDVPCRFDADDMQGEIVNGTTANRILGWSGIGITEDRL